MMHRKTDTGDVVPWHDLQLTTIRNGKVGDDEGCVDLEGVHAVPSLHQLGQDLMTNLSTSPDMVPSFLCASKVK